MKRLNVPVAKKSGILWSPQFDPRTLPLQNMVYVFGTDENIITAFQARKKRGPMMFVSLLVSLKLVGSLRFSTHSKIPTSQHKNAPTHLGVTPATTRITPLSALRSRCSHTTSRQQSLSNVLCQSLTMFQRTVLGAAMSWPSFVSESRPTGSARRQ